ncbi:MAG TPA: alpha/beta fold hydrolase [Polyangiaceae bacterium]|jgi:alpha-beta hydrolase superfamily lysophospholipase|nr:alpha/beta fold hydrolase [Polyangiaceae bacterium]
MLMTTRDPSRRQELERGDWAGRPLPPEAEAFFLNVGARLGIEHLRARQNPLAIRVAGGVLHAERIERSAGPSRGTVVFVPGTGTHVVAYVEFLCALADEGFTVLAFDPRGHGRSSGRRGDFTVPGFVTDTVEVVRFAQRTCPGPIFLSGSSQGGIISVYASTLLPELAGVIAQAFADLSDPESVALLGKGTLAGYLRSVRTLFPLAGRLLPTAPIPVAAYVNLGAESLGWTSAAQFLADDPLGVPVYTLRATSSLASAPPPRPLSSIKLPMLVLAAAEDRIFPIEFQRRQVAKLTNARVELAVLEKAEHLVLSTHPRVVLPRVAAWLERRVTEGSRSPS